MRNNSKKPRLVGLMNAHVPGISGGDAWFIEVVKRFTGYELTIMAPESGILECQNRGLENCEFCEVGGRGKIRNVLLNYILRTFVAAGILKRLNADVVYASSDFFPDVLPALFYKLIHPKSLWVQKVYHLAPRRRFHAWMLQKISHIAISWKADLVLVDNRDIAQKLSHFGCRSVYVCRPGVAMSDDESNKSLDNGPRCGAVYSGRIHAAKGIEELLEVWSLVHNCVPGAILSIMGTGEDGYLGEVKTLVEVLGIADVVHFVGYLYPDAVFEMLRSSIVCVTASREEGYGLAVMEALACETPVVCWDIPAFKEAFGDSVISVAEGDKVTFSKKVVELIQDEDILSAAQDVIRDKFRVSSWQVSAEYEESLIDLRRRQVGGQLSK